MVKYNNFEFCQNSKLLNILSKKQQLVILRCDFSSFIVFKKKKVCEEIKKSLQVFKNLIFKKKNARIY